MDVRSIFRTTLCAIVLLNSMQLCQATTKGLNQIVTPDVQPQGQFSVSLQQQDPTIGDRDQMQIELGVTNNFELAAFEGTSPAEQTLASELGLYAKGSCLLSTGFLNWTTKGTAPQPFVEAGYYPKAVELVAGAIQVPSEDAGTGGKIRNYHQTQAILGAAYRVSPRLLLQLDYQSGSGNFSTAGFTYAITPSLSLNPSLYLSNATPYKGYGYVVLTWNIQAFAGQNQPQTQPQTEPQKKSQPVSTGQNLNLTH